MKRKIDPELWLFRIFMLIFLSCLFVYFWGKANEIEDNNTIRDDSIINPILCVWEVKE